LVAHYGRGGNFKIDNNNFIPTPLIEPIRPYDNRIRAPVIEWKVCQAQNIEYLKKRGKKIR